MKKIVSIFSLSVLSVAILTGCNPVKSVSSIATGTPEAKTAAEYRTLKLDLDPSKDIPEYKRSLMPFADLPILEKYLNGLLDEIIVTNKLGVIFVNKKPHVRVSVDSSFNATTLANGLIVMNTGMLVQLETEAELQAVLAHELTHLLNEDHRKDEMQKIAGKGLQLGMSQLGQKYAGATDSVLLQKGLPDLLGQQLLDDLINAVVFTKWNREQELAADLSGVHLMHSAGINEKYMLKFLDKRKDFEINNSDLFESQNNEKSKLVSSLGSMFAGLDPKEQESQPIKEKAKKDEDSLTAKYYSAHTRYQGVKEVLVSQIGLNKLNKRNTTSRLSKKMPDYKKLTELYEVRLINKILQDKKLSSKGRYLKALNIVKKAQKGGLENNSYLNLIRASVYQSRKTAKKYAPKYRALALKDPNATLSVYSNVIGYYDNKKDKKTVLKLVNRVNSEMDYPNVYLPNTIKYLKKYGASTDMAEAQCVRTFDTSVARGCQLALGRPLKTNSKTLLNALSANDSQVESNDVTSVATKKDSSSSLPSLGKFLPF